MACPDTGTADRNGDVELRRAQREARISKIDRWGKVAVFLICAFVIAGLFGFAWLIGWIIYKCMGED